MSRDAIAASMAPQLALGQVSSSYLDQLGKPQLEQRMAAGVGEDLFELRRLLSEAKRPRVQQLLSKEIENLSRSQLGSSAVSSSGAEPKTVVQQQPVVQQQSVVQQKSAPVPVQSSPQQQATSVPVPTSTVVSTGDVRYNTLSTFSWEQTSDRVKIYYPLEGANEDRVSATFQQSSFDIKIYDVNGKNYRCGIPRLNKVISPENSKVVVKPKRIIVSLAKKETGNWLDLHKKEDKLKSSVDGKEGKDPMAGIMDMMKNMYEDGDDNMKRTIAQAWTEARKGDKSKSIVNPLGKQTPGLDNFGSGL